MTNQTIFRRILTLSLLLLLCASLPTVLANAMIELEVIKVDESNDPLAEAEFILEPGILGPNSVFVVESGASYLPVYAQSDSNGIVRFSFISPGVYRIREVTPPVGYIASGNELVLICDLDAIYAIASAPNVVGAVDRYRYDTPAIFVNTREAGSSINEPTNPLPLEQDITVRKTDEYGNPLAGAVFELIPGYFGQFGEFVEYYGDTGKSYQATSGANGNAIFQQVAPGVYRGYEVSPPFGYLPGTTEYYFVVNDGRVYLYASPSDLRAERELEQPAVFVNRSLPDLTIRKVDEDGNPLAGAIFVLSPGYYGQQQQFVPYPDQDPLYSTSTQNGYATFYQLSDGTYVLWESEPPQGYDQIPDEYYIIIDNGQIWIVGPVSGSISQNDRFPYDGPLVIVNQREEAELEEEVEEELEEKEEVEEEQIDELVPDPDPDPLPDPEPQYPQLNKEDHFAFLTGYPDKTFGPSRQMTRAEVAVMFARLLVEKMAVGQSYPNSFNDIPANAWYYNEIGYMEQFKVIGGYPDGSFRPDAPITRAEFAAVASRFDSLSKADNTFNDVLATHWAVEIISSAAAKGWITGYPDGTFRPDEYITRDAVAAITCRVLERSADVSYVDSNYQTLPRTYLDVDSINWAFYTIMEVSNGHDYTRVNKEEIWTSVYP